MALTISVVTPCYNSTGFLERLHRSLAAQSYRRFEWVCVDDRSTDATVAMLRSLPAPGELGMKAFALPVNSYWSMAMAKAVMAAEGELILRVDHDDELLPTALESIVRDWEQVGADPSVAAVIYQVGFPDGGLIGHELRPGSHWTESQLHSLHPDVTDIASAIRSDVAKRVYAPEALDGVCLNSIPSIEMARFGDFVVGHGSPLWLYHRDNAASQTLGLKLNRSWVSSYARLLDLSDGWTWRRPDRVARHALALARFSRRVHGGYGAAWRQLRRPSSRLVYAGVLAPAAVLDALRPKDVAVRDLAPFPREVLDGLPELRSGP